MAPMVQGPTFAELLPSPPLVPPFVPKKGPTVAPVPPPTFPSETGFVEACKQAVNASTKPVSVANVGGRSEEHTSVLPSRVDLVRRPPPLKKTTPRQAHEPSKR